MYMYVFSITTLSLRLESERVMNIKYEELMTRIFVLHHRQREPGTAK
jgi:hypothetical protein